MNNEQILDLADKNGALLLRIGRCFTDEQLIALANKLMQAQKEKDNELFDRLDSLAKLEIGWDGYRGLPVKEKSIAKAKEYLSILPPGNWQAVPGCDGSVQLELHDLDCDIEIYIDVI